MQVHMLCAKGFNLHSRAVRTRELELEGALLKGPLIQQGR